MLPALGSPAWQAEGRGRVTPGGFGAFLGCFICGTSEGLDRKEERRLCAVHINSLNFNNHLISDCKSPLTLFWALCELSPGTDSTPGVLDAY